jgi:hypothetical protein
VLLALGACGDNQAPTPDATTTREVVALPAQVNRELDVLFVLDNEASTVDHQINLRLALPTMFATLALDGPPDLHLAAVTPDMGSSSVNGIGSPIGSGVGACFGTGDNGLFFMDRFATDPGGLKQLFAVGSNGCGFQQPLAAMRAAFANPNNVGFRRPEAALAVIVLADEDDCSALDPSLFDPANATLGALSHFRCAQFGLTCAEPDMTNPGPRTNCVPKTDSTLIEDPADFIDVLRGQSSDPRRVAFGAIVGPSDVEIELVAPPGMTNAIPAVGHSCQWQDSGNNIEVVADEAVRLSWFADQFGDHGAIGSICSEDLTPAAVALGAPLRRTMGDPCVEDDVSLTACTAVDQLGATETPLAHCESPTQTDCWELVTDPNVCPNAAHQKLVVHRRDAIADGTYTLLRC